MKQTLLKFTLLCLTLLSVMHIKAQVTIGNNVQSESGALLQLTEYNIPNNETSSTASKGLLLPRIQLDSKNHSSNVYQTIIHSNPSALQKDWNISSHTGLTIYNITNSQPKDLCPGVYVWEGNSWEKLGPPCDFGGTTPTPTKSLNVSPTDFLFYSGVPSNISTNTITGQNIAISWTSNSETVYYSPTNNDITYSVGAIPNNLTGGTGTYNQVFYPNNAPVSGNWHYKNHQLNFKLVSDNSITRAITVKQIHKNLVVTEGPGTNQITVESNVQYNVLNTVGGGLTPNGGPFGANLNDGTTNKTIFTKDMTPGHHEVTFKPILPDGTGKDFVYQWDVNSAKYLNVSPSNFLFYSGVPSNISSNQITAQSIVLTWNPSTETVTHSITGTPTGGNIAYSTGAIVTTINGSPQSFKPDPATNLNGNFDFRKHDRKFILTSDPTMYNRTITVSQIHKNLVVTNITSTLVRVDSNVEFTVTGDLNPTGNYGVDLNDGTSNFYEFTKDMTPGTHTATFIPKNVPDPKNVVLTWEGTPAKPKFDLSNPCAPANLALGMDSYLETWYALYCPDRSCGPGTNGSNNTHQVQWHKDSDENIFFSALFGSQRWMVTNVARKKGLTYINENLVYGNGSSYHYPGSAYAMGQSETIAAQRYNMNPKLGLLYNFATASRICPSGWRLPNASDIDLLTNETFSNFRSYTVSTYNPTDGGNTWDPNTRKVSNILLDQCSGLFYSDVVNSYQSDRAYGVSSHFLQGGFDLPVAGRYNAQFDDVNGLPTETSNYLMDGKRVDAKPCQRCSVTSMLVYKEANFWINANISSGIDPDNKFKVRFSVPQRVIGGSQDNFTTKIPGNPLEGMSVRCVKN